MMPKKITAFVIPCIVLTGVLAVAAFAPFKKSAFETVKVEGGLVSGTTNTAGDVHIFRGIPFAAPPIGDLRWKAPQPVAPWQGVKKCDAFGPSPMQGAPVPFGPWSEEYLIPKEPISEDCLYLNVWTGASSAKEKRPVIVWIYGGGFASGGAGCAIYDGEAMAKKGIIFVSVNYRVGIFGFFAHPELTKESPHNASGNYGLLDQIAGLEWVKKNIAAFGGDPNNVTVAGQSAGSMSVNCLVASPLCKGLFKHAIAESGASFITSPIRGASTLKEAEADGAKLGASIADLRKMPAEDLMKKQTGFRSPIVDGYVLPQSIAQIFAAGKENDVDLLTGWNEDDGVIFGKPQTAEQFKKQAKTRWGADASMLLQYYPASSDEEAAASQGKLSRDQIFGVQNYTWANIQAEKSKHKVFLYHFTRRLPAIGDYVKYGAFHTGEVAYAYDNLDFVHRCPWQPVDRELAKTMSTYWANFVKTGNPNGKGLPAWPVYNTTNNMTMILGDQVEAESLPGKARLDFLIKENK
ncbi:MAG TPA: carboxylesterase family protein [Chitinophagaceae bacterium]|nr:carboxylesterase family protein [Chitinophagaceae bacterium]